MNPIRLFKIILKEHIKKPGCIFIILLIPILTALINVNQDEIDEHSITIGYYFDDSEEDDDGSVDEIRSSMEAYNGIYTFTEYDDVESIKKDLILNKLECAYIIPANFRTIVAEDNLEKSITIYISTKSTMTSAINETFFARLFPTISETSLELYLTKVSSLRKLFKEEILSADDIRDGYQKFLTNDSTFHFNYEGEPEGYKASTTSILLSPLKGLIGLMILISSLSGAFTYFKESDSLVKKSFVVRITYILVPTLLSSISAYITILVSDGKVSSKNPGQVLLVVLAYMLLCTIFTFILTVLIKSPALYASIIPMLIIGTLVFTPFIIDFSTFVPLVKKISYVFIPYYFMTFL